MKNTDFNVTFIGFGNMGSAIVRGISKENLFSEINVFFRFGQISETH